MRGENVSVVIPFFNEEKNVGPLLLEIETVLEAAEVIAVDDGSTDRTWEEIRKFPRVIAIRHSKNLGQSAALWRGLQAASREFCVMLDGDGQNNPADIPKILEALKDADLVCGYRAVRRDSWSKRWASKLANSIRRLVLTDPIRDTGCTLKAVRRQWIPYLFPFDGLHRYIAALLAPAGARVVEVAVDHRPRRFGVSKYTISGRAWRGVRDLIGVRWLVDRQIRWTLQINSSEEIE